MPYILPELRPDVDALMDYKGLKKMPPGHLNYLLTRITIEWLRANLPWESYAARSRARAVLQDASDEFYRRMLAEYEDQKCTENGEVYC
jgi:hypothetical protein